MRKASIILALVVIALGSIAPVERARADAALDYVISELEYVTKRLAAEEELRQKEELEQSEAEPYAEAFIAEAAAAVLVKTFRAMSEQKALEAQQAAEEAEQAASGTAANK
jgi:hypothetical protein